MDNKEELVYLATQQGHHLAAVVQTLADSVLDGILHFSETGIRMNVLSQVFGNGFAAMLDLKADKFTEYRCNRPVSVPVAFIGLKEQLTNAKQDSLVIMRVYDNSIEIVVVDPSDQSYQQGVVNRPEFDEADIGEFAGQSADMKISMPSSKFLTIIRTLHENDNAVQVTGWCDEKTGESVVFFVAENENTRRSFAVSSSFTTESGVPGLEVVGKTADCRRLYPLRVLAGLAKANRMSPFFDIYLQKSLNPEDPELADIDLNETEDLIAKDNPVLAVSMAVGPLGTFTYVLVCKELMPEAPVYSIDSLMEDYKKQRNSTQTLFDKMNAVRLPMASEDHESYSPTSPRPAAQSADEDEAESEELEEPKKRRSTKRKRRVKKRLKKIQEEDENEDDEDEDEGEAVIA